MKLAYPGRWALDHGGASLLVVARNIHNNQSNCLSGGTRQFLSAAVTITGQRPVGLRRQKYFQNVTRRRARQFSSSSSSSSLSQWGVSTPSLRFFATSSDVSGKDEELSSTDTRSRHCGRTTMYETSIQGGRFSSLPVLGKSNSNFEFVTRRKLVEMILQEEQRRHLSSSSSTSKEEKKEEEKESNSKSNNKSQAVPPPQTQRLHRERPRIQVPHYGPDADKAMYNFQKARKEQARAKTAANVRRALVGNCVICVAKLGAWASSGSSSMMSEFVHSVVDCGNQSLLLMGLRDSRNAADRMHPYGYGKAIYFWALVSALGTFFLGAGVSMSHAVAELSNPSLQEITNEVWAVLVLSFTIDGYVLYKTIDEVRQSKPANKDLLEHVYSLRDPATLAVLLEDGAACLGIVIAIAGISASHMTAMPIFDGMAGVGISCLLGSMGLALVRVNHRFLLGTGIDKEMTDRIEQIIRSRRSIDNVYSIQSQWTGPETFSFKAEVDFDGTYLAAQLMPRYQGEFQNAREDLDKELEVLLCWYAEDVMRAVEREIRHIEAMIRQKYPGAEYIELEPMGKDSDKFAIDDSFEEKLFVVEKEEMQRLIRVLYEKDEAKRAAKRELESQATNATAYTDVPEGTTSSSQANSSSDSTETPPFKP